MCVVSGSERTKNLHTLERAGQSERAKREEGLRDLTCRHSIQCFRAPLAKRNHQSDDDVGHGTRGGRWTDRNHGKYAYRSTSSSNLTIPYSGRESYSTPNMNFNTISPIS